jgi:plastocyanin
MSGFPNIDESPFFSPSQLVGSPGQKISLQIINQSLTEFTHNFSLTSQNIDQDIPWHQSINETVVFPSSGAVFFYCKYHNSIGQVGVLRTSAG